MEIPSLDFALGEDINMLRETLQPLRRRRNRAAREAEIDRDNLFPADLWKKFGDLGPARHDRAGRIRRQQHGLPGAHHRHGRNFARLGFGRPLLRRSLQPVREPDPPRRQ
jgi:hypothetical protein